MKTDMKLATFLSVPVLDTFWHAYRLLGGHSRRPGKGRVIIVHLLILTFVQSVHLCFIVMCNFII